MGEDNDICEKMKDLRQNSTYDNFVTQAVVKIGDAIENEIQNGFIKDVHLEKISINLTVSKATVTEDERKILEEFLNQKFHKKICGYIISIKKCWFRNAYKVRCRKV